VCIPRHELPNAAGFFPRELLLAQIERLLSEYEADLERSREMCSIVADYGLLEPFTMQATLPKEKGGGSMHVTGMHRVSEKTLENLNAAQLKNLLHKGIVARIYMHLLSLENFARLLERKAARPAASSANRRLPISKKNENANTIMPSMTVRMGPRRSRKTLD
jgi:hypothetical protein